MMFPDLPSHLFDSLPLEAQTYIREIQAYVRSLQAHMKKLEERIRDLEDRLAKNSSNSSKPPSTDGFSKKTRTLRIASGKKPGAQWGHEGRTLIPVECPDSIVVHIPLQCAACRSDLSSAPITRVEKRQVFDLPKPHIEVVEHQAETRQCLCCGGRTKAEFPQDVTAPVQYGGRIHALIAYFDHQHFIPADRLCQLFEDVFGLSLSEGTCANVEEKLYERLASFEANLKAHLIAGKILHLDETGARCAKKLHWIHVASTSGATFYGIHERRGQMALDVFGIIGNFRGRAIHDHWIPYFSYTQVAHGLCNAHHLRELTYVYEEKKEAWAGEMRSFLLKTLEAVRETQGQPLAEGMSQGVEVAYAKIVVRGLWYYLGGLGSRAGKNLLMRLADRMGETLAFVHDPDVPFTNNQAEQDLRMVKVRQKISGCFRVLRGGTIFCRIRSYLSTGRKRGWNPLDALEGALRGAPWLLPLPNS